jgi:hypothetical protein
VLQKPWNSTSTWLPAGVPGSVEGDVVVINTGHTVTLNVSPTNTLASVTVNNGGTLLYDYTNTPRILRARTVTVNSGGTIDLIFPDPPPTSILSHELWLEPLSTDPANEATTFQNNGTVNFVRPSAQCNIIFSRSTKGPQWLRGTGTQFNLSAVVMVNTSTLAPTTDFAPPAETDATQTIGEQGGSQITMRNLLINNAVAQVRGRTSFPTSYREDNPTIVLAPLKISQFILLQRGILILNRADNTSLTHEVGNIQIGSGSSIAVVYNVGLQIGARHNTGIALVSAANATTTLTVTGNVTAPSLSHANEGVVIALVSPASGTGSNDNSNSGATMTVNGNFNFSGARLGLVGNGTQSFFLAGDIGPGQGGFANGTMQFNFKGDFKLKNGSRYNGRRGGGGSVPGIRFDGTTQTFDAPPNVWYGSETNAITNWEIAANSQVTMTSTSGIAIHGGSGLTVNGTLIAQNGAELISTFTGGGSGKTLLTMGSNGIIRVADPEGLGNGDQIDPSPEPLFIGRQSPSSPVPEGWNLTSINTNGTIDYNGTALQTITARNSSTAPNIQYHRLTISGGDKTLESTNGSVFVNDQLTLQGGIVSSVNASDVVRVLNTATGAITRSSGHINARLERTLTGTGSEDYFYPIGDADDYRPLTLNDVTASDDAIIGFQEIRQSPRAAGGTFPPPPGEVSNVRYWLGSRVSGTWTGAQSISLDYGPNDGVDAGGTSVVMAHRSNTINGPYANYGQSAPVPAGSGTLTSASFPTGAFGAVNQLEYFTLGTTNPTDNPLPVELVGFKGEATVLGVVLEWQTARSETTQALCWCATVK